MTPIRYVDLYRAAKENMNADELRNYLKILLDNQLLLNKKRERWFKQHIAQQIG